MNSFKAQILTPEGSLFDDEVTGVKLPGTLGSFEVKTLHANIISTLEVGEVVVRKAAGEEQHFAITGGFVEVVDNTLNLLAEAAEPVGEIDIDRAKAAKERALERLESGGEGIDKDRAQKALERAKNRIRLYADVSVSTQ
ncbi:ATP synthase F1 subunit epsilon [Fodinibius sediminis]|uniref:ATP synthase epsilon chain n=1 Tax=Fodinibius sediminis TaxID=1214077 RepID=A0A521B528_9BACT|nr:ATP synthase F1 subunit epsilon [Fodinibius sediminis]SMO42204.1 ATP synthase F1 subcomplex epsilon subunit [Fodinibius sediminis]